MHDMRQNRSPHEIVNNISRIYGAAAGAVKMKITRSSARATKCQRADSFQC